MPDVDDYEIRDLERHVRGLEGKVRGFKRLPSARDLALIELEKMRTELEWFAWRREQFGASSSEEEDI